MQMRVKNFISIFYSFRFFNYDFIIYLYSYRTYIAALNTVIDDVTNLVKHRTSRHKLGQA